MSEHDDVAELRAQLATAEAEARRLRAVLADLATMPDSAWWVMPMDRRPVLPGLVRDIANRALAGEPPVNRAVVTRDGGVLNPGRDACLTCRGSGFLCRGPGAEQLTGCPSCACTGRKSEGGE